MRFHAWQDSIRERGDTLTDLLPDVITTIREMLKSADEKQREKGIEWWDKLLAKNFNQVGETYRIQAELKKDVLRHKERMAGAGDETPAGAVGNRFTVALEEG